MKTLVAGSRAPTFALPDKDGHVHRLEDIAGDCRVLFFYPKDNTPGCTIESIEFSKSLAKLRALNTTVVGISGGDQKSKTKFCTENKLKCTMLSDADYRIAKKYGVYGPKKFMGRSYVGIYRTTFIIDNAGKILKVFDDVSPKGHAEEVLNFVKELGKPNIEPKTKTKAAKRKKSLTKD